MANKTRRRWVAGSILVIVGGLIAGAWLVFSRNAQSVMSRMLASTPTRTLSVTWTPTPLPTPTITLMPTPLTFDSDMAYLRVLEQCGFGPRPPGTVNNQLLGDYLVATVKEFGWATQVQAFTYQSVRGRNIIARKGQGPLVLLGAHYDTRPYADYDPPETREQYILGANDGASGVAVLLELARVLDIDRVPYEVRLVFFDAEDSGNLNGWPFSVGAREYAQSLDVKPEFVIVVDMVGDENQTLYWEGNSDPALNAEIWALAADLGYGQSFIPRVNWSIIDDHLPFIQRGWTAIDIIDFDYPYWHTTQDTADKVSAESLGRVGRVLEVFLEERER